MITLISPRVAWLQLQILTVYYHHIADWCTWVTNRVYHPRTSCVFHPRTSCVFDTWCESQLAIKFTVYNHHKADFWEITQLAMHNHNITDFWEINKFSIYNQYRVALTTAGMDVRMVIVYSTGHSESGWWSACYSRTSCVLNCVQSQLATVTWLIPRWHDSFLGEMTHS